MRAVAQRVREARITVAGELAGAMGEGLLALVGVGADDGEAEAEELAAKLVHLRVFADAEGRMNRSLLETGGALGVMVVTGRFRASMEVALVNQGPVTVLLDTKRRF